tara:strand:+ start:406 stop:822 length:417 start_codon:yes stop_codon:yes gene_type:complete
MAVADVIALGLVGSNKTQFIITRGLATPQNVVPIIARSNELIGDIATEDRFRKGLALTGYTFVLVNKATGAAITSGSVTTKITKDGGTQGTTTNSAVHEGNGQWSLAITSQEMDADIVGLAMTHTDALTLFKTIKTRP